MRGLRSGLAIAALALQAPARADAPAAAPPDVSIGVVAIAPTAADRERIAAAIAAAAHETGAGRVVVDAVAAARDAVAAGAVPIAALARFREIRAAIDDGWRAYTRVQLDAASRALATARDDARGLLALPGGNALFADASLRLGAVLLAAGQKDAAASAFALALAFDPDRPVTELEFAPDIVAAVAAARVTPPAERALDVDSDPAGAAISVDGRDAGRAPVSVRVAAGDHVAIARAPEHHAKIAAVTLTADASAPKLTLALERDEPAARLDAGAALGLDAAAGQRLVDDVLDYGELDAVVLVALADRAGGPTLLVQRCAGSPARCTDVTEVGAGDRSGIPAAARAAWQSARTAALTAPPSLFSDARAGERHVASRCELCRNPYVLGGIGAAIVAGAVVAIVYATASKPAPELTVAQGSFTH